MDFLLTCALLPPVLVMTHRLCGNGSASKSSCCSCAKPTDGRLSVTRRRGYSQFDDVSAAVAPSGDRESGIELSDVGRPDEGGATAAGTANASETDSASQHELHGSSDERTTPEAVASWRCMERFFMHRYSPWMAKHSHRVLLGVIIFAGVALNFAPEVTSKKDGAVLVPSEHNQAKVYNQLDHLYPAPNYPERVALVWGVLPVDNGRLLDPTDEGTVTWDPDFDPSHPETQVYLVDVCNRLIGQPQLVRFMDSCWIYEFRDWITQGQRGDGDGGGRVFGNHSFPVPQNEFDAALDTFVRVSDEGKDLVEHSVMVFDTAEQAVMATEGAPPPRRDPRYPRLLSVCVDAVSTMHVDPLPEELRQHYDAWEALVQDINREAEAASEAVATGASRVFHVAHFSWVYMSSVENLTGSAKWAIVLSLALALVVMVLATANLLLAVFVIMTIGSIVLTVLALMVWTGVSIGILEALCLSLVAGLSVDYTSHLGTLCSCKCLSHASPRVCFPAVSYSEFKERPREERATLAVSHMGISVVAAALTTFISGVFLLFCQVSRLAFQ